MATTTKTAARTGIVIDLDHLQVLVRKYLAHLPPRDRLESQLRFSHLLMWLRKREEKRDGEKSVD